MNVFHRHFAPYISREEEREKERKMFAVSRVASSQSFCQEYNFSGGTSRIFLKEETETFDAKYIAIKRSS